MNKYAFLLGLAAVVLVGALGIIFNQSFNRLLVLQEKRQTFEAVDGCNKASDFIFEDKAKGSSTRAPMRDVFEQCMKDKGLGLSGV